MATGRQESMTDAKGIKSKTYYDDAGRRLFVVENYQAGYDPTSNPGSSVSDENRTTGWRYNAAGQVTELTAYNGATEEQTTKYFYNDDYNASLVTETIYPDSLDTDETGTDQVKMTYHLDGSLDTRTDQRGVVMTYVYDNARRTEAQFASTIPSGVDDSIVAIGRDYDSLGRVTRIYSADQYNLSGQRSEVNYIKYTYNPDHGRLATSEQNHNPQVSSLGKIVSYGYDNSATNNVYTDGLRLESVTYPDGYVSHYDYGSADSIDDLLGRVKGIYETSGSGQQLTSYAYNGTGRLVKTGYETTGSSGTVSMHADRDDNGEYGNWDRFGRVTTMAWMEEDEPNWGAATKYEYYKHNYDLAGNRTTRNNWTHWIVGTSSNQDNYDQEYFYDNLHRLKNYEQGDAHDSGGSINQISSLKFSQDWDLDQLGNWSGFDQDDNGDGTDELTQTRTHNEANELETITSWTNPAYDKAGNMTTMPGPSSPTESFTAKYDAWNRLVVLHDIVEVVGYRYDGLHRRIIKDVADGSTDDIDYYYNNQWQVLEEHKGGSGAVHKKYVYHPHYVDAVAVQYNGSGSSTKHFYIHDAQFNVTAIMEEDGDVVQRYSYTPYGQSTILQADFSVETGTPFDNEYLFTGRRLDPETELQINRNRYYHKMLGRWINRDPVGYLGGNNLFAYVSSSPLNYYDPYGLWEIDGYPDRDQIPQDCGELLKLINAVFREIEERWFDLSNDPNNLQNVDPTGYYNHQNKLVDVQEYLFDLLDFWDMFCDEEEPLPEEYYEAPDWPLPNGPSWYWNPYTPPTPAIPSLPSLPFPTIELPDIPPPPENAEEVIGIGCLVLITIIVVGAPVGI